MAGEWMTSIYIKDPDEGVIPAEYVIIRDDTGEDVRDTPLSPHFTTTRSHGVSSINTTITITIPAAGVPDAVGVYRIHSADSEGNLSTGYGLFRVEPNGECLFLGGVPDDE